MCRFLKNLIYGSIGRIINYNNSRSLNTKTFYYLHYKIKSKTVETFMISVIKTTCLLFGCSGLSGQYVFQSKYMWGQQPAQQSQVRVQRIRGPLCVVRPGSGTRCSGDRYDRLDYDSRR